MPIVDPFDASSNKIVDPFESSSIVDPFEDETPQQRLARKTEEYRHEPSKALSDVLSPSLPLGLVEQIPAGIQAVGGVLAGGIGGVAGALSPGKTAKEGYEAGSQWFNELGPVQAMTPETKSGQAIAGAIGAGVEYAKEKAGEPSTVKSLLGAVPFVGGKLKENPTAQAALSGYLTAVPELSMVAPGLAHGKGVKELPKPKDIVDPFEAEPTAHRGSTEQIKSYLDQNDKDILRTENKIKQIEQDLKEHQFDNPEQAKQYQDARLEEVRQHQQTLNELYASKENAEAMLRGETPQPKPVQQEQPTGQPPRPEGEPFVRPEEAPKRVTTDHVVDTEDSGTFGVKIMRHEDGSVTIFHDEGIIEYNSEFASGKTNEELLGYTFEPEGYRGSSESPRIDSEQTSPEIGTDPSIRVEEVPVEEISISPMEDTRAIHELDLDTVEERIGEVRDGLRDEGEFDALIKRRAELENAEFMGP